MWFGYIYDIGRKYPIIPKIKSIDKKFERVQFPYNSTDVLSGVAIFVAIFGSIGGMLFIAMPFLPLIGWSVLFYTFVIAFASYIYATGINYTQRMIDYREEMLLALLEIGNFISLDTSIEYAIIESNKNLHGVLHDQFNIIIERLNRKKYKTLGDGFANFIPKWLEVSPDFVKALSLLQTAAISLPEDKNRIIDEVIESIIQSYYEQGKRFTEELSSQTQSLIAMGVLFPMMMLMMIPMVSVFLPDMISLPMLIFGFNLFFPTLLLMLAMQFAANRVQVNTIRMEQSPKFKPMSAKFYLIPILIMIMLAIPAAIHLYSLGFGMDIKREYSIEAIVIIWISTFGIFLAVEIITGGYVRKYKKLWNEIYEVEQDLPHLLQVFAVYLSLNRSVESILADVIDDYERHGFKNHPVTHVFKQIQERLIRTKKTIFEIVHTVLPKLNPSKRVTSIFEKVIGFTDIDQISAAKSAKMIRKQQLSIFKLDDYIKTLLADTISLVYAAVTFMAPMLSGAAVIMAMAIVMSLTFIQDKLESIFELFGGSLELGLVKMEKIIPPTMLEFVIGIYFMEMVIILSLFLSNIKYGTDKFKIAETININMLIAFALYTVILLVGYFVFKEFVFEGILKGGTGIE